MQMWRERKGGNESSRGSTRWRSFALTFWAHAIKRPEEPKGAGLNTETPERGGADWVWHKWRGEHFMVGHAQSGKLISQRAERRQRVCVCEHRGHGHSPNQPLIWCKPADTYHFVAVWACMLLCVCVRAWLHVCVRQRENRAIEMVKWWGRDSAMKKKEGLWCFRVRHLKIIHLKRARAYYFSSCCVITLRLGWEVWRGRLERWVSDSEGVR